MIKEMLNSIFINTKNGYKTKEVSMVKKLLAILVGATMLASLLPGCSGGSKTIKIGGIQPISGKVSAYGTQSRDAINMAIKEINAKGGVLGKQLESVIEDDEAIPEKTLNAFTKLVTKDKVVGIIGALTSNCSKPLSKEAQKRGVVMITPSSTNAEVTMAGDYVFRACFIDPFQGTVNAKFAIDNLKAKTAAVVFDNTNDYSIGLKDNFIKTFKELGGTITNEESYATGDKDFSAQLTKIETGKPDILFIPDYYSTVSLIAKQARGANLKSIMLGGDGWEAIANNAGEEVDGSYYSNHYTSSADDAEVKAFVAAFKAAYGVEPNALAALAYDATYLLADAIAAAGSTDSEKIRDALAKTDKKFVTGRVKFDENRNPIKSVVMVKVVKDGSKLKEVYETTVNP